MMKRVCTATLLGIIFLSISTFTSFAQDFTFTCDDPVQYGNSGGENAFVAWLTNISAPVDSFEVELDDSQIGGWSYFWCAGAVCLPPGTYNWMVPLQQGQDDSITVHVFPDSTVQDQGSITVTAYPQSNPGSAQSITFTVYFGLGITPENESGPPTDFTLHPAFPNPFNPTTAFRFDNAKAEAVDIAVYDVLGNKVRRLLSGVQPPGMHLVVWDGRDDHGAELPAALYVITVNHHVDVNTLKVLKLK